MGPRSQNPGEGELDALLLFVQDAAQLDAAGTAGLQAVKAEGLLWVCYPKGGRKAGTDLNRDILWRRLRGVLVLSRLPAIRHFLLVAAW